MSGQFPPPVPLATLYERESAKGTRYFTGRLGLAKLVMFPGDATADGTPTWNLLIQQPPPKAEAQQQPPRAPQATHPSATNTPSPAPRRPYQHRSAPRPAASGDPRPFDDPLDDIGRSQ
jgi:hypothetical protein